MVLADLALRPEAEAVVAQYSDGGDSSGGDRARAVFVPTDVTSWPALERLFDAADRRFGGFDLVCPGAGVYEPAWSSFWHPPGSPASRDDPAAGMYALLAINLVHPIRTTQLAISRWLYPRGAAAEEEEGEKDGGEERKEKEKAAAKAAAPREPKRVVLVSSVAGQMAVFGAPLYGASKFGVTGLARCLGPLEAARGIRVLAVAPGVVRSPLWSEHPDKLAWVDPARATWIEPADAARAMLRCAEDPDLPAGSVLEIAAAGETRLVHITGDPGPDPDPARGLNPGNHQAGHRDALAALDDEAIWGPLLR